MKIKQGKLLKDYSYYRIGGPAKYFAEVENLAELRTCLEEWRLISQEQAIDFNTILVLGEGTNLLFPKEGYPGLVIKNNLSGLSFDFDKRTVKAGSGYLIRKLAIEAAKNGFSGLEWAGGLPGTVGGAVRGNSGAFGGKTSNAVKSVASLELASGKLIERDNADCLFGYRDSVFKNSGRGEFILEAVLELKLDEKEAVLKLTQEYLAYRKKRHPMDYPSLGCMFKNIAFKDVPDKFKEELRVFCKGDSLMLPTASLIEKLGLKGVKQGGVEISEKHANFFVNCGGGLPDDVKTLLRLVKERVRAAYGIELEEEIEIL